MKTKEAWYAVVGGCVGAVLTMVVCSFSPLGAQSQSDGNFGKIICTRLEVVDADGTPVVHISANENKGFVAVSDSDRDRNVSVFVGVDTRGGTISIYGKDTKASASMVIGEHGGGVMAEGNNGISSAAMGIGEHDGFVGVKDKNGVSTILNPD